MQDLRRFWRVGPKQRERSVEKSRMEILKKIRCRCLKSQEPNHDPVAYKAEMLFVLSESGCFLCREELKAEKRFFTWFVIESHGQRETLEGLKQAHGFCTRHTRMLLSRVPPSIVVSVYRFLVSTVLEKTAFVEKNRTGAIRAQRLDFDLKPFIPCPVCARLKKNSDTLVFFLRKIWGDPEVRCALEEHHPFHLRHFLQVADRFDWEELSFAVNLLRGDFTDTPSQGTGTSGTLAHLIWGAPPAAQPSPFNEWQGHFEHCRDPRQEPKPEPDETGCWSPTLAEWRKTVKKPGCPICRAEKAALRGYFKWLQQEINSASPSQWQDAVWLCREHGSEFIYTGDDLSAAKLTEAARDYWLKRLEQLHAALGDKPEDSPLLRVPGAIRYLRRRMRSDKKQRAWWRFQRLFMTSLKYVFRSPASLLAELRQQSLRENPCPACRCVQTARDRTCDLLIRSLADPDTRSAYEQRSGICFRHLPRALEFADDEETSRFLLQTQRVRLSILAWELEECSRKRDWSVRYESKGPEHSAGFRAAVQYSGI
jgi:hypothetical protein